ncbi:MAG: hypothetical protein ACC608_06365 [Anaerofustis sp.]
MRKWNMAAGMMVLLLLAIGMAGCGRSSAQTEKDAVILRVVNQSEVKMDGLCVSYGDGQALNGSMGCVNANGSPWEQGESMELSFLSSDFEESDEMILYCSIRLDDGRIVPVGDPIVVETQSEEPYEYELVGTGSDSLRLNAVH